MKYLCHYDAEARARARRHAAANPAATLGAAVVVRARDRFESVAS